MTPVALYEGTARHRHHEPVAREFAPQLFMAYLDVDALPASLDGFPLWSARRAAPVRFQNRDFFDGRDEPLGPAVRDLVAARLGRRPQGPIFLLAHLRTFGWLFNPLAVYYCWSPNGQSLDAIVLEVTNTPWHERCWYVFDARNDTTTASTPKAMHVSPFLPMDLEYRVSWTAPGAELQLRLDLAHDGAPVFDATLALRRVELDRHTAVAALARRPLMPQRVSTGIYTQAACLFAHGAPTYRHPERLPRTPVSARVARRVLTAGLERLTGGALRISDADGDQTFGDAVEEDIPMRATVRVHDPRAYRRVLLERSRGLGDSYADRWWDTDDLTTTLRLARRNLDPLLAAANRFQRLSRVALDPIARTRRPDKERDARNVRAHYDLGNEFFERLLDETMMYSCAVFDRPDEPLEIASTRKLDRLAQALELSPCDHVLEIGTGWGGFAVHAATEYGCRVTTTTISRRQYDYACRRVERAGLGDLIEVRCVDYRDLDGTFSKVVAIEMIEAVDWRDYDTFFAQCRRLVADTGALAMQAIVVPDADFDRAKRNKDFIKGTIFPGSCIPSVAALNAAARRARFSFAHLDDIGMHYAETLRRWRSNLDAARDDLETLGLDERFARLWDFYLAYCEAGFEERVVSDVQLLYTAPAWRPASLATQPLVTVP
jgi:cyclopropane-fatty-acyl-phospholipid synthase